MQEIHGETKLQKFMNFTLNPWPPDVPPKIFLTSIPFHHIDGGSKAEQLMACVLKWEITAKNLKINDI